MGGDDYPRRSSRSSIVSWAKIIGDNLVWEEEVLPLKVGHRVVHGTKSYVASLKRIGLTALYNPSILIITLVILAFLLGTSLATIKVLAGSHSLKLQTSARDTAKELGSWMSSQLDEALLPLFAMSQFVQHLDDFKQLPFEIGPRGELGSAPPLLGKETSHRNVTGICDDPDVSDVFNEIAANVKKDAGLEGILVNIQLAPQSVVCLLYPLVNTEDFPVGTVMNNTGAPNRVAIARATVPSEGVVIAGPLTLIQEGTPVVKEAFIARLAINMEGYKITVDNEIYPCWGFAVILLNWAALKEKSGIDEMFRKKELEYRLTRTDVKTNTTTGTTYEQIATIAESEKSNVLDIDNSVSVDLNTTNNIWKITVGYKKGFVAPWLKGLEAIVITLSLTVALLLMTVLVNNQERKNLLYKMMPSDVVEKLQRGETVIQKYDVATVFFSDVVGFTKLSSELSPVDVMEMLNEMYSAFDELVEKHKIYKVDTIGDAYIAIGGGPDNCLGRIGAEKVALFALDAMEVCKGLRAKNKALVRIRAGLASGPVVAGVVGNIMPKFTLFGDTVNFASRMESTSETMRIQCSDTTYRLLNDVNDNEFELAERIDENGEIGVVVKGKGRVQTWFINDFKQNRK